MTGDLDIAIRSWCLSQMAGWRARGFSYADVQEEYRYLNETRPVAFIFHVRNGIVSIEDKPDGMRQHQESLHRANLYLKFIQDVVTSYNLEVETSFVLEPSDQGHRSDKAPIFVFQKQIESNAVLFPDIDFLGSNFYVGETYEDHFGFNQKSPSAMFVGSTSGAIHTEETVRAVPPRSHRLRAAEYFKHDPNVRFLLPVITQCDTEATANLLRDMGYGDEEIIPWKSQMMSKFIISMDGNGATCSRVAIALKSNSALLKYNSPHLLYYFSHLIPWRHYIPISDDSDVDRLIEMEIASPGLFRSVATEGRLFAERYLTKAAVSQYAAELIKCYAEIFPSGRSATAVTAPSAGGRDVELAPVVFECLGHIQDRGDVWAKGGTWVGEPGSGRCIEGIMMLWTANLGDLSYQVAWMDGTLTDPAGNGEFRGTRGLSAAVSGFRIDLGNGGADRLMCHYSATFVDGSKVGLVPVGQLCRAASGAALESFQIEMGFGLARK